jgi:hypothetical protein
MLAITAFSQTTNYSVALTADNTGVVITGFSGTANTITIPDRLEGLPVKVIGKGAFSNQSNLKAVTIPRSITIIEDEAFKGTRTLTNITFPDTLQKIGAYALDSTSLASVNIPNSCIDIGEGAFNNCQRLITVNLPGDLQVINANVFMGCQAINTINFPANIKKIDSKAFADCRVLATLNFPSSISKVEFASDVFVGCPRINLGNQAALKNLGYAGSF